MCVCYTHAMGRMPMLPVDELIHLSKRHGGEGAVVVVLCQLGAGCAGRRDAAEEAGELTRRCKCGVVLRTDLFDQLPLVFPRRAVRGGPDGTRAVAAAPAAVATVGWHRLAEVGEELRRLAAVVGGEGEDFVQPGDVA